MHGKKEVPNKAVVQTFNHESLLNPQEVNFMVRVAGMITQ